MRRDKTVTAAELLAELNQDPEFQEREMRGVRQRKLNVAAFQRISAPVLQDLKAIGITPSSLDRLAHEHAPLSGDVVAILLKWIPNATDPDLQESLIRSLGASGVSFNGKPLVRAFEDSDSETLRWAIANTIAEARPTGIADWLLSVVQDPSHGAAREMLTLAVARLVPPQTANEVLLSVFDQLPGHVALALGESGGQRELAFLGQKRSKYKGWIRQEIDKSIRTIRRKLDSNVKHSQSIS